MRRFIFANLIVRGRRHRRKGKAAAVRPVFSYFHLKFRPFRKEEEEKKRAVGGGVKLKPEAVVTHPKIQIYTIPPSVRLQSALLH